MKLSAPRNINRQTDRRQTDGTAITYSELENKFTFAKNCCEVRAFHNSSHIWSLWP